ncbi:N-acetyltransferase [Methanofollis formosanus]|uniref:N-acetyltransferase n=1 Tax=Methanofollis formosanus TaxID=299308 RepID=A0A8G1A1J7_9EURY|nr:GNAT family N-acetyltransferase [Methanofollis formosanus]QYZ79477.1 N-acetyltransferase [Methanofollis formosanus]
MVITMTTGLTFTYLTRDDVPAVAGMLAKESVCEWMFFGPNTPETTEGYFLPLVEGIEVALTEGRNPECPVFTIREKETGAFVGQCALLPVEFSPGAYLIGYQIDEPFWGKGYGTEACEFLVHAGFNLLGGYRLNGDCAEGNVASVRVMEKCGFVEEGRQRKYWHARGGYHDRLLFGLLREDLTKGRLAALGERFGEPQRDDQRT